MKLHSQAAERNSVVILEVLRKELPNSGFILEIASGSGQHAAHFCADLCELQWQPSDINDDVFPSIDAWSRDSGVGNCLPPVPLDVCSEIWPVDVVDGMFCANMIHISPWTSTLGLFAGAGKYLSKGAPLVLYGPFLEEDRVTAASNETFDKSLRTRNPLWGIRSLSSVKTVAENEGLQFVRRVQMPAQNLCVVFHQSRG